MSTMSAEEGAIRWMLISYSQNASLAFLVWDIIITYGDEVELVWSLSNRSLMKWLFLFARYFPVLSQTIIMMEGNWVFGMNMGLGACRARFVCHCLATQAMTVCVESVLMIRVYALFDHHRLMFAFLMLLLALEVLSIIPAYILLIPKLEFTSICVPVKTSITTMFFGYIALSALALQTILTLLTLFKTAFAIRAGWGRTPKIKPIIHLLIRDGTWVFGVIFFVILLNALFYVFLSILPGALVFTWYLTFMSVSITRLILNQFGLGRDEPPTDYSESLQFQFSTQIDDFPGHELVTIQGSSYDHYHQHPTSLNPQTSSIPMASSSTRIPPAISVELQRQ
ncbi:hypothetical protein JAAARDRAFT_63317 [Jaapia argillacea MUCL 33604]|uniref:DUF6533 domain-containing protein n=1 Tax=Jaapia argillacea MUCL 33604 TaxID=933084 RepID=A0A067P8W0_9AGAM|nr:hypothetical protein JAAARDRAFT_63317 [Jaapia argillacea MUCL 33604]